MSGQPGARGRHLGRLLAAALCALALQGTPAAGAAAEYTSLMRLGLGEWFDPGARVE